MPTKGWPYTELDLSNEVDRMTHSVDIRLFSQPPMSQSSGFMNKVISVARTEVMSGLSNMDFYSQGQPGYRHAKRSNCQQQRQTLSVLDGTAS